MFLKSLEIFGFKSFADRTRIEFADGISCLLGPNGCGKSNVVDAIKWVVGEQAARSLRAEKMEDVIFNGTETRKPLNVAEVTVTISNEKNLLPIDNPEISIKRRLYRSGESEYFINNQPMKLKDLRELFWDTGVGKSAYSVMEQGKIDQILSSKPEERRYLFEEAAGITRHKVKSREAESKLEKTEENMRQVEGILGEVKRSYELLKNQCDKTLKYRTAKEAVFNYELDIQLLRLKTFLADRSNRDHDIKDREKARDTLRGEIDAINQTLEENMDMVNSMESKLVEHQKTIYGLAVERVGKEKQKKVFEERIQEARIKIDAGSLKIKSITEKLEGLYEDIDEKETALRDFQIRIAEIEKNIAGFEEQIQHSGERIRNNDSNIQANEQQIASIEKEERELRVELEAITEDIVTELDKKLKDSGYSIQERKKIEAELDTLIGKIRVSLSGRAALLGDLAKMSEAKTSNVTDIVQKAEGAMKEAIEGFESICVLFESYKKTAPNFIDDFLSPEGIITKKRAIDKKIENGLLLREEKKALIVLLRDENRQLQAKIEEYRATLEDLRVNRMRMKTQVQGAEDAVKMLRREIQGQENLRRENENEVAMETKRRDELKEELTDIDGDIADIEKKGRELTTELEKLEKSIAVRNSDVSSRQDDLKKKVSKLGALQSELERIHLDLAQIDTEVRNIKDNFREQHGRDLLEFEERMFTIRVSSQELRDSLAKQKQDLRDLGSVNLMAPEEFQEVKERYDFLSTQLADLEKAREDLNRITAEIRHESTEMFLETYNKIKKNFHNMFRRLFGGGRAELHLVDPEHVLTSGIEIYAQPPGKKLENITLLSGGEKSMTAVGLLFATYMVKPSPFCFLDEIDAALDEQNVLRFVQLLIEFGRTSQFIVITHNKKTVTGANTLLGVTMEESGITKVIAVRLENRPGEKAEPIPPAENYHEEEVQSETGIELPSQIELDVEKRREKRERAEKRRLAKEAALAAGEAIPVDAEDEIENELSASKKPTENLLQDEAVEEPRLEIEAEETEDSDDEDSDDEDSDDEDSDDEDSDDEDSDDEDSDDEDSDDEDSDDEDSDDEDSDDEDSDDEDSDDEDSDDEDSDDEDSDDEDSDDEDLGDEVSKEIHASEGDGEKGGELLDS